MKSTFGFIATGKPHVVAAACALGREHIIPEMFRAAARKHEHNGTRSALAVDARLELWDGVLATLEARRKAA